MFEYSLNPLIPGYPREGKCRYKANYLWKGNNLVETSSAIGVLNETNSKITKCWCLHWLRFPYICRLNLIILMGSLSQLWNYCRYNYIAIIIII